MSQILQIYLCIKVSIYGMLKSFDPSWIFEPIFIDLKIPLQINRVMAYSLLILYDGMGNGYSPLVMLSTCIVYLVNSLDMFAGLEIMLKTTSQTKKQAN